MRQWGPDPVEHGKRLSAARQARGLTVSDLAQTTGATVRQVANWQSGLSVPTPNQYDALHNLLGNYDRGIPKT